MGCNLQQKAEVFSRAKAMHKEGYHAGNSYRKKWSSVVLPHESKKLCFLIFNAWTPSPPKSVPAQHGSD